MMRKLFFVCCLLLSLSAFAQDVDFNSDNNILFKNGLYQFEHNNFGVAQASFEQYLNDTENNANGQNLIFRKNAQYYIAICALQLQQPGFEKKINDYADKYMPEKLAFDAKMDLADFYFQKKQYQNLLNIYETIDNDLLTNEQLTKLKFKKAYALYSMDSKDNALASFVEISKFDNPYQYPAAYYAGLIYFDKGKFNQALDYFEIAEKNTKYQSDLIYYIAKIKFDRKEYQQVIGYIDSKGDLSSVKQANDINLIKGQAYFELQDFKNALPYLENYLTQSKTVDKQFLYQLAYAQYKQNMYDKAIANFKQLAVVNDTLGQNALFNLGNAYLATKQYDNAITAFLEANKLNFDSEIQKTSLYNLSKLEYKQGFYDLAIQRVIQYNKTYPNNNEASELNNLLADMLSRMTDYEKGIDIIESQQNINTALKITYQKLAYQRAMELISDQKLDDAKVYLNKTLKYPSDNYYNSIANYWLGDIAYSQKKYAESIQFANQFLISSKIESKPFPDESNTATANYLLGYDYFDQNNYTQAKPYFETALNEVSAIQNPTLKNKLKYSCLLRIADCNFVNKNFSVAQQNYQIASASENPSADYALYQLGIMEGLNSHPDKKISLLNNLIQQYPTSIYADNAYFEMGNTYFNQNKLDLAYKAYETIHQKYSSSALTKDAYLKQGLIEINRNNNDAALKIFKQVVENYPNTTQANEALLGIKDIYIEKGNSKDYIAYVSKIKGNNISASEKDSLSYEIAEKSFLIGNYKQSNVDFMSYLDDFPDGHFKLNALFYLSEGLYFINQNEVAYPYYQAVLKYPDNRFMLKSLQRAALIAYELKKYKEANDYFAELEKSSDDDLVKKEALKGLMRTSYYTNDWAKTITYCEQIKQDKNYQESDYMEANYLESLAYLKQNQLDKALPLSDSLRQQKNEIGAESQYNYAQILYLKKDYENSKNACMELSKNFGSYETWVIKSFILLSDNYMALGEYFDAKSILSSVVENYKKEPLYSEAKQKLSVAEAKEKEQSKVETNEN